MNNPTLLAGWQKHLPKQHLLICVGGEGHQTADAGGVIVPKAAASQIIRSWIPHTTKLKAAGLCCADRLQGRRIHQHSSKSPEQCCIAAELLRSSKDIVDTPVAVIYA
jgi:hypothetical protein